ncbi:nuclear envelope pore membrane protein POM 121 [Drosophila bipectinata]|uniref:nuclear envelope pore membrane protein POM 121 n=1 Tax=Drosophila bipectinata TaxID=42026 RepID=UPI001C88E574|nr:mucin-19 [Drosophila bipectinata]
MERQFSLSNFSPSARLANPMADSTRIDASSISSGHPAPSVLGLSPRRHSSLLNGTRTPDRSFGNQTSASISRQKLNLSQLDPKTFADVHSSGLASRIVSYHDNSLGGRGGLQRSMSASNLYNPMLKPRRMPGAPLPYKATVPALSLTKIAPPERSFYSGNTLPSLLRSNSLVGVVHKASEQEQLSRENRPIMHPPHPQHDSEPTRSVLDELKEISRKRINSGDPQSPHDFTKRSCQRVDFVDHLSFHHHQQQHQQTLKRQRELTVAVPLRHHSMVLAAPPPTLPHIHSNGSISPQQSPEQLAKRRNCSFNNGIASSLSSSRRHTNKRKLFNLRESIQSQVNDSVRSGNSPDTSPVENAAKVQRKVDAVAISKARSMPPVSSATTAVLPRTQSVPQPQSAVQPATKCSPTEVQPRTTKPKLTLFNATQNEKKEQTPQKLKDLDSPDVDAGEYAGIQFVKPKQQSSSLGVRNLNADRTTKTKLAIMLSGLKGELYQGEPDELDATLPKAGALPTPIKPTVVAPTVPATTGIKTTVSPTKPVILSNQFIKPPQEASAAAASSSTTTLGTVTSTAKSPAAAEVKPIPSLPAVVSAPSSTAAPTPTTAASPKSTDAAPKPFSFGTTSTASTTPVSVSTPAFSFGQKPTSGPLGAAATGFKLETPISKTLTTPTTTSTETPAAISLSFGAPPKPVTSSPAFGGPPKPATSSAPALNFGMAGPTAGSTGTSAPMPVFGAPAAASSAPKAPTATVAPLTSSGIAPAPGNTLGSTEPPKPFAFGQASSAKSESSAGSAAKPAVFSFGGSPAQAPAPAAPQPTDLFGSQSKAPAFGGAFSAPTATKPEPAKPGIFGSQANSFGSAFKPSNPAVAAAVPAEPTNPFSFNATTPTASAPKPSTNLFSFGGATTPAKPAAPAETPNASSNPPIFGQAKLSTIIAFGGGSTSGSSGTADQNKPAFAFGGGGGAGGGGAGDASKPSSVFSFGGEDKSNTAAAPPAPSTSTSTSNGFGFGQVQKPSTPMFGSGSTATQDNTNAMGGSKPFSFGGSQQPAAPSGGGFSFASVAKKAEEPKPSTNIFGSPASGGNASFGFGGNGNNQAVAQPAVASGGFSFASVAGEKEEPASNNLFGNPGATNPGVVKPAFNFGGSTSSTPQAAPSFGGGSTSATQAAPSFGGGSTSTPSFGGGISSTPQAAPSFGGFGAAASTTAPGPTAQSNKPFAFGGSSAGAAPPGGNLFASAVAAAQSQPSKPASFSFGAAAKPPASNATGNAPFSFSGAAAGGIASQPSNQSMNTPKQFSFGGASSNPVPNAFASPAPSPVPTNASAGAFNYGGATTTPTQPGPPGTPENRPIRKATRRLQK